MAEEKENQIKFDPGSPIGCGIAIIVFGFAIVSLNWGFFTSMTDWGLKDGEIYLSIICMILKVMENIKILLVLGSSVLKCSFAYNCHIWYSNCFNNKSTSR